MAVEAPQQIDQADYEFKPQELDPDKVLLCLPGWTVSVKDTSVNARILRYWSFKEPNDRLGIDIEYHQAGDQRYSSAHISRFERTYGSDASTTGSIYVEDLKLIVAQVRPTNFCLGLYSTDGSYFLSKDRSESPYLPDYIVSVYAGRDPSRVPSWTDRAPFKRFFRGGPRSHTEFQIPRIVTG